MMNMCLTFSLSLFLCLLVMFATLFTSLINNQYISAFLLVLLLLKFKSCVSF